MRAGALATLILAVVAPAFAIAQQPGRPAQPRPPAAQQQPPTSPPPVQQPPAVQTPAFSVGVVDIPTVLRRSTAAQGLQRQFQAEQEKFQGAADQQQRAFQTEEEALERQRPSMSADAYTQKRQEFQEKVNNRTAEFRLRRRQIDEAFNNATGEIDRALSQVIEELARQRGIELVLRREAVVYVESGDDLTAAALEGLNRLLPEVTVQLPPQMQ